jgi:hypothetical protein
MPSMPWSTYAKLSPECQLYCRYLLLGEEDEPPEWGAPGFRSGGGVVKQTVARL